MTRKLALVVIFLLTAATSSAEVQKPQEKTDIANTAHSQPAASTALTQAEKTWIEKHNTIRVGMSPVFPPLKFTENGEIKGIEPDYVKLLSEYTGIKFEYVICDFSEMDAKVKSGEIDMFISFHIPERLAYMSFTVPLMDFKQVIITRNDAPFISGISALKGKKIATVKGVKLYDKRLASYPDIERVQVDTMEQMFRAVSDSKADALIARTYNVGYLINNYPNLKIAGIADFPPEPFLYAIRKDYPELVVILNKAIKSISQDRHDAIVQKWVNVTLEYRPNWSHVLKWAFAIGSVFAIVLGLTLFSNRRLAREIEKRKRTEDDLLQTRAILQAAMDQSSAGIAIADAPDGTLRYVNDAGLLIRGGDRQSVVNEVGVDQYVASWMLLDLDGRPLRTDEVPLARAIMFGETSSRELIIRRKEGEDRIVLANAAPIKDQSGKVSAGIVVFSDITEHKLAEETKAKSEHEFRMLAEAMPQIVWITRPDGWNIYFNQQWMDYTGLTLEESYGHGWNTPFHPDDKQMAWDAWQNATKNRATYSLECRLRRADGVYKWWLIRGLPLLDERNTILKWFGTCTDIDELKHAEEEKLALEKQLQQSQKLESLGVLAGGIAHDFNNILAVIICNCSLAIQRPNMAEELIHEIEKAAERAADLCRQMLAYAGKAQFVQSHVNMSALLDEMLKMLKATLHQNIVIKSDLSADIPYIKCDASQIRQIIMNLIINASEAIGEAQGEIHVSLAKTEIHTEKDHLGNAIPPGWYACLEITDNGCGMDDETMKRIFEPFYSTKFMGRGLGVSAALGIITAHGGALQLSSQAGRGTTFKVYLPVEAGDTADEPLQQVSSVSWQGSGTILLVEDEPQLMLVAKTLLKALGFDVFEAENGREALELYRKNADYIKLVVTDVGMPVMDGYELFRELKKIKPELPIIISSGYGDMSVASQIPEEETVWYLSKPYNLDQLRKLLKRVEEAQAKKA